MTINNPKILYIFSFLTVALSSGLVYGYPHLRTILYNEGSTLTESQLGLIFTVGSWTECTWFFTGMARDKFGSRNVACISLLFSLIGIIGLSYSHVNDLVMLVISYFFVGLGSGGMLCFQPVANLFTKKWQGTILASLSGAFQISGLVFYVLKETTLDRKYSFRYFSIVLLCLVVGSFLILPKKQFLLSNNSAIDQGSKSSRDHLSSTVDEESNNEKDDNDFEAPSTSSSSDDDHNDHSTIQVMIIKKKEVTIFDQITSLDYIFLVIWITTMLIPMQYYIGTIALQMERKGDTNGTYTNIYSIFYASSALITPLMGRLADATGPYVGQMIATILVASSLFILASDQTPMEFQIIGMACNGMGRVTMFGMFFTSIGKRFGFRHYGTLSGLGLLISSILSLLQFPLIHLAARNYEYVVNICSACIILAIGVPYCVWGGCRMRNDPLQNNTAKPTLFPLSPLDDVPSPIADNQTYFDTLSYHHEHQKLQKAPFLPQDRDSL